MADKKSSSLGGLQFTPTSKMPRFLQYGELARLVREQQARLGATGAVPDFGPGYFGENPKTASLRAGERAAGFRTADMAERQQKMGETSGVGDVLSLADLLTGGARNFIGGELAGKALEVGSAFGFNPIDSAVKMVTDNPEAALGAGVLFGGKKLRSAGEAVGALLPAEKRAQGTLARLSGQLPTSVRDVLRFTDPLETSKILYSQNTVKGMDRLLRTLPNAERMAAGMKAGEAKKGWYEASAKAILETFGMDAPRFAALLAATSPQTSVESNLLNTVNIWKNWVAAGRPRDRESIMEVMGRSVQGDKGEDSILDAWRNNTVTALSTEDMRNVTLSGPKVDSFMRNLRGDVDRVTLDAWMANGMGISQDAFSGSYQRAGDPGITAKYGAISGRMRDASKRVGMTPAEGQETFWSLAMPLYEESGRLGVSAQELLQKGWLTNRTIRGTPDFANIFQNDKRVRGVLEDSGYGSQIENLTQHKWPDMPLDSAPDLSIGQQRHVDALARIIDDTRGLRGNERTSLLVPDQRPKEVTVHNPLETVPGANSGVGDTLGVTADIPNLKSYHQQQMNALKDPRGRNRLVDAVYPGQSTELVSGQGAFMGPNGMEYNPASGAAVTDVPLYYDRSGEPQMYPGDKNALRTVNRLQGIMYQQNGVSSNAVAPYEGGTSTFTTRPKGASRAELEAAYIADPNTAYADTGRGVAGLDIGKGSTPVTEEKLDFLNDTVGAPGGTKKNPTPPVSYQGKNIASETYIDHGDVYKNAPMGSGELTTRFLADFDKMPKWRQEALDRAGRVSNTILHQDDPGNYLRRDTRLFRQVFGEKGVPGLRQGLLDKIGLPAGLLSLIYGADRQSREK